MKSSRELLLELGYAEVVVSLMTDEECDELIKRVIFVAEE